MDERIVTVFNELDEDNNGYLTAQQVKSVWIESKLPPNVLLDIYRRSLEHSQYAQQRALDLHAFRMSYNLIQEKRKELAMMEREVSSDDDDEEEDDEEESVSKSTVNEDSVSKGVSEENSVDDVAAADNEEIEVVEEMQQQQQQQAFTIEEVEKALHSLVHTENDWGREYGVRVTQPVWQSAPFLDLYADAYIDSKVKMSSMGGHLEPSLTMVSRALTGLMGGCHSLILSHCMDRLDDVSSLKACLDVAAQLDLKCIAKNASDDDIYAAVQSVYDRVRKLKAGQSVILPGGWFSVKNADATQPMLYVVCRDADSFTFSIVNANPSACQYHAATFYNGQQYFQPVFSVRGIALELLVNNSTFWYMLVRMQSVPVESNDPSGAVLLYERLVPYLSGGVPTSTLVELEPATESSVATTWYCVDNIHNDDSSFVRCVLAACKHVLLWRGWSLMHADSVDVCVRWSLARLVYHDLIIHRYKKQVLSPRDKFTITQCLKDMASRGGRHVRLRGEVGTASVLMYSQLQMMTQFVRAVDKLMTEVSSEFVSDRPPVPQRPEFVSLGGHATFQPMPLFDCIGRDDHVEELAGSSTKAPLFRPVQFTLIPSTPTRTYHEVIATLVHCDHICTLLAQQSKIISNTSLQIVSLINHMFLRLIPLPLRTDRKTLANECFWRQTMRYETQSTLLRLLLSVSQHFVAASLSLHVTRSFDGVRILIMACIATIADAVMRVCAVDLPSVLSLHYSGSAPPHVTLEECGAFRFEMCRFDEQSEFMKLAMPELLICRTKILDYFNALKSECPSNEQVIFEWDRSMKFGSGDARLMERMCWEFGVEDDPSLLPYYLSGQRKWLLSKYPEFEAFRDIVFLFKYVMTPTNKNLPEIRPWRQMGAQLTWHYSADEDQFVVKGFHKRTLHCMGQKVRKKTSVQATTGGGGGVFGIFRRFLRSRQTRTSPSGGDPSALLGVEVNDEEDILHVDEMPSFGGLVTPQNVELLASYLTVPYLRIPLVLGFFASNDHIKALGSEQLQNVLDGVMFEPGPWRSDSPFQMYTTVPAPQEHRDHLATPCGLLFNELQMSPKGIVHSLGKLLELALELDTGQYTEASASVILYVIRLITRVEGFVNFLLRHHEWRQERHTFLRRQRVESRSQHHQRRRELTEDTEVEERDIDDEQWIEERYARDVAVHSQAYNVYGEPRECDVQVEGASWASNVRGLELTNDNFDVLRAHWNELKETFSEEAVPLLQRWINYALRDLHMDHACMLYAHLAYMRVHVDVSDFDMNVVESILTGQMFINAHFEASLSTRAGEKYDRMKVEDASAIRGQLGIPDIELFDFFHKQRQGVMEWINEHKHERDCMMERVIATVTQTKARTTSSGGSGGVGGDDSSKVSEEESTVVRHWESLDGWHCVGRFVPTDLSPPQHLCEEERIAQRELWLRRPRDDKSVTLKAKTYYEKFARHKHRGPLNVLTEINVQLGTVTLNASKLRQLDREILDIEDLQVVLGHTSDSNDERYAFSEATLNGRHDALLQCPVKVQQYRTWHHVMGKRLDLHYWVAPDASYAPSLGCYEREYNVHSLRHDEAWIGEILEPLRTRVPVLSSLQLMLPNAPLSGEIGHLASYVRARARPKLDDVRVVADMPVSQQRLGVPKHVRHVVVLRARRVVLVFDLIEHGRRFYRSLVYSSNSTWCLSGAPRVQPLAAPINVGVHPWRSCGHEVLTIEAWQPQKSLVIFRNLGSTSDAMEQYVPPRLLEGVLPAALLESYHFWQSWDDVIVGYMKDSVSAVSDASAVATITENTSLRIELVHDSGGGLHSERAFHANGKKCARITRRHAESGESWLLLDLLYAPKDSMLYEVASFLGRFESLAYCLAWSSDVDAMVSHSVTLDAIELPRLGLSFFTRVSERTGKLEVRSMEHVGLFVSDRVDEVEHLLVGMSHGIVLENDSGELFALVPASKPVRPPYHEGGGDGDVLYPSFAHSSHVEMCNEVQWLEQLELRHFLYRVHLSCTFLFTPTLSSVLYLLVLRFAHRQYEQVLQLLDSESTYTPCLNTQIDHSAQLVATHKRHALLASDSTPCETSQGTEVDGQGELHAGSHSSKKLTPKCPPIPVHHMALVASFRHFFPANCTRNTQSTHEHDSFLSLTWPTLVSKWKLAPAQECPCCSTHTSTI